MSELSPYFCPKCGHYAYFQLSRNALCHRCHIRLRRLEMSYRTFTDMDLIERDRLITRKIIEAAPSLAGTISETEEADNHRRLIARLTSEYENLTEENRKLNQTVEWMHDTIWDLLRQRNELKRMLEDMQAAQK